MSKSCLKHDYEVCKTDDGITYRKKVFKADLKECKPDILSQPISEFQMSSIKKSHDSKYEHSDRETADGLTFRRKIKLTDLADQSVFKKQSEVFLPVKIETKIHHIQNELNVDNKIFSARKIDFGNSREVLDFSVKLESKEELVIKSSIEDTNNVFSEKLSDMEISLPFRRKRKNVDKLENESKQPVLIEKNYSLFPKVETNYDKFSSMPKKCPEFPEYHFIQKSDYKNFPSSSRIIHLLNDLISELRCVVAETFSSHSEFINASNALFDYVIFQSEIEIQKFNSLKKSKINEKTRYQFEDKERKSKEVEDLRYFYQKIRKNPVNIFLTNEKRILERAMSK